jgi:hypothetical protein
VKPARERLHKRSGFKAHRVGKTMGVSIGRRDVFGVRSVAALPQMLELRTEVVAPRPAEATLPTDHAGLDRNAVARPEPIHLLPGESDLSGELVSHREREVEATLAAAVEVKVGLADADGTDAHEQVARPDTWYLDLTVGQSLLAD